MSQFSIEIPNPGIGTYQLITNLLLTINCVVFGALFFGGTPGSLYSIVALAGIPINAAALGVRLFKITAFGPFKLGTGLIFLFNTILWVVYGRFLIALLMGIFAVAGIYANRRLHIDFKEEGIEYPSFPSRTIPWIDVEQVICKDGMLSIDLKNNKLLQFNIVAGKANNLNELDFNAFCKSLCG